MNIPCSLRHVRETIYNSIEKLVSKRLGINSVCDDLTLIRHDHVSWSPSRLTAEIQRFLLSVVVSSNCSPLFLTNDGIRKNLWVFFFSLFLQQPTTMQTTISTTAFLHLFELVLITFEGHQHGG